MATGDFDECVSDVRNVFNAGARPALLAVVLNYDSQRTEVCFKGNTTSLRHLMRNSLHFLMKDAEEMTALCPCARCHQSLDLLRRTLDVLTETIPADQN